MSCGQYAAAPAKEQIASEIHIDTATIPVHARDQLSAATLDLIRSILQRPGGREALDARTAARQARNVGSITV